MAEKARTTKTSAPKEDSGLPRVRTYASDMSRAIRARGETLASIVNTEQRAAREREKPRTEPSSRGMLFLIGGLVLFVLGIVVVATTLFFVTRGTDEPQLPTSLIFPNKTAALEFPEGESLIGLLAQERSGADLSLGEIERVVVVRDGVPLPPNEVARALGIPNAIAREAADIMVGIHSFDRNQPFIIMKVVTYDRTFEALLEWERDIARALGAFFAPRGATPLEDPDLSFHDEIIRNLDARKSQDAWPILYAYPVRTLIVITTNEFTLREITTRLGNAAR